MSQNLEKKLLQVSKFIQKGQYERAVKEYQKLLLQHKKDPKILNSLGDTYVKMKKIKDALDVFSDVAAKYVKDGFYPNAIAIYRKMLRLNPSDVEVKFKLGELYVSNNMISEAQFYFKQYGDHYLKNNEIEKAIPAYEKICKVVPENMELQVHLAGLYTSVKNIEKMFETYQRVFDHYRNSGDY